MTNTKKVLIGAALLAVSFVGYKAYKKQASKISASLPSGNKSNTTPVVNPKKVECEKKLAAIMQTIRVTDIGAYRDAFITKCMQM